MARQRKGRPSWFRMPSTMNPVINALDDADVGRGLKLALNYFVNGEYPGEDETPMTLVLFSMLKIEADNSLAAYKYAVEKALQEQQESNDYESINESTFP